MKYLLIALLVSMECIGFSQSGSSSYSLKVDTILTEISLSDTLDTSNCDFWENGDYRMYVERQPLLANLMESHASLVQLAEHGSKDDTIPREQYQEEATRYLTAINQLRGAGQGFDLKQLIVFTGPENDELTRDGSSIIENYVLKKVEKGRAIVHYKGERIFRLSRLQMIGSVMSETMIFYDDPRNYAYLYYDGFKW